MTDDVCDECGQHLNACHERDELRARLEAVEAHESTLASLCDWINTHCRECGVDEADWYTLLKMRDAIDRIVFAQRKREHELRAQLVAAEARCNRLLAGLDDVAWGVFEDSEGETQGAITYARKLLASED